MGIITIKVPQEINLEYEVDNVEITENILERLKGFKKKITKRIDKNILLGLFSDEVDLIDEITGAAMQARENSALRVNNG